MGQRDNSVVKKLNHTYSEKLLTVRQSMLGGLGLSDEWNLRPWVFVRREAAQRILANIGPGIIPKITYLDTTAWEWEYGVKRWQGGEPGKPYDDLDLKYQ